MGCGAVPELLDVASRSPTLRTVHGFGLPTAEGRAAFLARWTERLDPHLKLPEEKLDTLVRETDSFSFAYLKELCLSAVLRWMKQRPPEGLYPLLTSQLDVLRAHMRSEIEGAKASPPTKDAKNGAWEDETD